MRSGVTLVRMPSGVRVFFARHRHGAAWDGRSVGVLPVVVTGALVVVACRLLALTFVVFQHAYLNSYWLVPGARVASAYWAAVRFAFQATVLLSIGIGLLGALLLLELRRAARR